MSPTPRWGYTGLLISFFIAVTVWALKVTGVFASLDGLWYDRVVYVMSLWRDRVPEVLLVHMAHDDLLSDTEAIPALEKLEKLEVRRIVLNFLPRQVSSYFYQRATEYGNVYFGRGCERDPRDPDMLALEPLPAAVEGIAFQWGVVQMPPELNGIYRRQHSFVTISSNTYPALCTIVALPPALHPILSSLGDTFLVDFVGPPGRIPNVSLARVLSNELFADMARGKTVLWGYGREEDVPGLYTPVSHGNEPMSLLEFQANALQTLIDGAPPIELGPLPLLFLLIGVGMAMSVIYQRVNAITASRIALEILAVQAIAAFGALGFFRIWIELGVLMLAQVLQYVVTMMFKIRMTSLAINVIRLRSLAKLKERFCPENFYFSQEYWDYLASMIHQTLDLQRMVFLERLPKSPFLREIKAVNCGFEDLLEKERQIHASPFVEAIETKSPLRVFDFLKPLDTPENQYLCPLQFAGEVLGIWVFSIDPSKALAIPQFDLILLEFSEQIAQLLYHKKKAVDEPTLIQHMKSWFTTERENETYRELSGTTKLLEQHYNVLEALVGGMSTATIVYDLFGRVLSVNDLMTTLLNEEDFVPTKATTLDLIRQLTGKDEHQSRYLIRHVILEKTTISLPVALSSQPENRYLLRLYPLAGRRESWEGPEPFRERGLVCELIDVTPFSNLAALKGMIAERLGVQLRNDFAAIDMSASLLEGSDTPESERQKLANLIHERIQQAVDVIAECQKYLEKDVSSYGMECYPMDVHTLFNQLCSQFAPKLEDRHLKLDVSQPRLMNYVLASAEDLTRLFSAIFGLLIKDAAENTTLSITVETQPQWVTYHFVNSGFGIPDERLQKILSGSEPVTSEEFKVLRNALSWVHNWEGNLEIASGVGAGYAVALTLRQFM
jgi:signal transduction histidine kinase